MLCSCLFAGLLDCVAIPLCLCLRGLFDCLLVSVDSFARLFEWLCVCVYVCLCVCVFVCVLVVSAFA